MDRSSCMMCTHQGGETFCDYYDYGYMKCVEVPFGKCPDGLDDEELDDDDCCPNCYQEWQSCDCN